MRGDVCVAYKDNKPVNIKKEKKMCKMSAKVCGEAQIDSSRNGGDGLPLSEPGALE